MNTEAVAKEFVARCKADDFDRAEELWADDVVSLEPQEGPMARAEGRAAVRAKGEWWRQNNDLHEMTAKNVYVTGDQFLIQFHLEFTPKATGERRVIDELALYTVKNGKIVEERYFY